MLRLGSPISSPPHIPYRFLKGFCITYPLTRNTGMFFLPGMRESYCLRHGRRKNHHTGIRKNPLRPRAQIIAIASLIANTRHNPARADAAGNSLPSPPNVEEKAKNVFLFRRPFAPNGCYESVRVTGGGWGNIHQIDMLFHVKSCRSGLQWPQTETMAGRPVAPAL